MLLRWWPWKCKRLGAIAHSAHANVVSQLSVYYKLYIDLSNCPHMTMSLLFCVFEIWLVFADCWTATKKNACRSQTTSQAITNWLPEVGWVWDCVDIDYTSNIYYDINIDGTIPSNSNHTHIQTHNHTQTHTHTHLPPVVGVWCVREADLSVESDSEDSWHAATTEEPAVEWGHTGAEGH